MKALLIVAVLALTAAAVVADDAEAEVDNNAEADTEVEVEFAAGNSPVEKDVLKWLNIARTTPVKFAQKLQSDVVPKYSGKIYHSSVGDIMTNEGVSAVNGAIAALRKTKRMKPLTFSIGLNEAAAIHAIDEGKTGSFSHTGTDGSSPWDRMARFGKFIGSAAENMGSGYNNGFDIVAQLIIDDGVPSRGHRTNILNGKLLKVGISVKPHKVYKWICVQDFASQFVLRQRPHPRG